MNWFLLMFYAAVAFCFISGAYLVVGQFYWYLWYGTQYDQPPWFFTWINGDRYVTSPTYQTEGSVDNLTPQQTTTIRNLMVFIIYMTILWMQSTTPTPTPPLNAQKSKLVTTFDHHARVQAAKQKIITLFVLESPNKRF